MGKRYTEIKESLQQFIGEQQLFFVATAAIDGRVNVSPKGMDSFRIIHSKKIIWLNLTGSGNETAAHLLRNPRMTIMFCSFKNDPLILRLYGKAMVYHERDDSFQNYIKHFENTAGARQIFEMVIDLVQTSCGFGVPIMDFNKERTLLKNWSEKKGPEKIRDYWKDNNELSIDDFETGIFE